jgi:hypothetical protein
VLVCGELPCWPLLLPSLRWRSADAETYASFQHTRLSQRPPIHAGVATPQQTPSIPHHRRSSLYRSRPSTLPYGLHPAAARPKDGSWEVKIADFGLSKTVEVHHAALAARRAEPGGPTATAVAAAAAGARDG